MPVPASEARQAMSHGTDADRKDLGPPGARRPRRWTMGLAFVVALGGVLGVVLMRHTASGHPRRPERSGRVAALRRSDPPSAPHARPGLATRVTVRLAADTSGVA